MNTIPYAVGWSDAQELITEEFKQSREEGKEPREVDRLEQEAKKFQHDPVRLIPFFDELHALPVHKNFPFEEPDDLPSIQAARKKTVSVPKSSLSDSELLDRLYGAWLGRCCGCALGKPVEGFMGPYQGLSSRQRIRKYLTAVSPDEYPLRFYIPGESPASSETGHAWCFPSTREKIAFMESDDDIRYTVVGQIVLGKTGRDFTTHDVMMAWLQHLPYYHVCTAEKQAYRNYAIRYHMHMKPEDTQENPVDWNWVATHQNPYREWIGAQIRVDSWGYAAPGNPALAAEFAWRDARMSHVKNGIYGAMFCAAMIASAFALEDPLKMVQTGLSEIPASSRLHQEMLQVIEICQRHHCDPANFEAVLDEIEKLLGHYHPVHTDNNAALVVAALLLGDKDYEKSITIAVMGGWDTDCNGATVGSILGAMLGAKKLPKKWTAPLHDTLYAEVNGYHPIAISECAKRSFDIAQKIKS